MSYILEALRKADDERQLARQRPADLARPTPGPGRPRRIWPWVAAAAIAVNAAAGLIVVSRMPSATLVPVAPRAPGESAPGAVQVPEGARGTDGVRGADGGRMTEAPRVLEAMPAPEVPRPPVASRPPGPSAMLSSDGTRAEGAGRPPAPGSDTPSTKSGSVAPSERPGMRSSAPPGRAPEARGQEQNAGPRAEPRGGTARLTGSREPDRPAGDLISQPPRPTDSDAPGPIASPGGETIGAPAEPPRPETAVLEPAAPPSRAPVAAWRSRSPARSAPATPPDTGGSALRLDVHVYSERAGDRMVFINNRKYVEGQRVDAAHVIEEITPEGAVLSAGGQRIFLGR